MLRGVVPDSFPCQPTVLPVRAPGQRRFVVMDDNVHRIYGERVQKVRCMGLGFSCTGDHLISSVCKRGHRISKQTCLRLLGMTCLRVQDLREHASVFSCCQEPLLLFRSCILLWPLINSTAGGGSTLTPMAWNAGSCRCPPTRPTRASTWCLRSPASWKSSSSTGACLMHPILLLWCSRCCGGHLCCINLHAVQDQP